VPFENPQGRRVNFRAAYRPDGPRPRLRWWSAARTWTSADLLQFLGERPASKRPRVVVLDNAGLHTSKAVRAERPALARRGVYLYYLPPYSPELNRVEAVFRQVKYHQMPRRSHDTLVGLRTAVDAAMRDAHNDLAGKREIKLRPLSRWKRSTNTVPVCRPPPATGPACGRIQAPAFPARRILGAGSGPGR
jgi:transposase